MGFLARAGMLAAAAAILFVAIKLNKSSKKGAKNTSIVIAFIAGLAALATIVGDWMTDMDWLGLFAAAGLIVCTAIIIVDWLVDKKPDRPAMYAAFAFGMMVILGASNLDSIGDQIGDGGKQVSNQLQKMGDGPKQADAKPAPKGK
ncbi:hypothetical protein GCM10010172_06980 [Paractinoplanes ferrugineus]|uniref:Uncharacterized protein n=1 Tax=Paractinoplanes ferrugineus TaxID=113564 RepID=A0A919JA16_9ACTN|nr:hypothetical protein [Actinoplanes ferrugineus]GIE16274.1 hypothetical protein Afe05nite_81140 [Actinoplanes ferrugineus]